MIFSESSNHAPGSAGVVPLDALQLPAEYGGLDIEDVE